MIRATEFAQQTLRSVLQPGAWAVDATVGNGYDTLFLAQQVGPSGRVFGFDLQAAALAAAAQRVADHSQVTLLHTGHENLVTQLPPEARGRLAAVMFNLGYLPGAPKEIITRTETTLAALAQALEFLQVRGIVTIILYPGHSGGGAEALAVRSYLEALPSQYAVAQYRRLQAQRPAPELLIIQNQA